MSREEDANRLADDLESLQTGKLSESEFRAKCQAATVVPELRGVILPNLDHYLDDLDIREPSSVGMPLNEVNVFNV